MSTTYMMGDSDVSPSDSITPVPHSSSRVVSVNGHRMEVIGRSLEELSNIPGLLEPLCMVVPRVVAEGRIAMIAAREKLGKSTWAAFFAAMVSRGGLLWGEVLEAGVVLWVGLEEDRGDAVRRFLNMGGDPKRLILVDRLPGEDGFLQLLAEVEAFKPRLIVIDSLAAMFHDVEDENGASAWTKRLRPLVDLARTSRAGIVLLHHANKAQGSYRGSTAIGANMDMILEMSEVSDDASVRAIKARGRWPLESYAVRYDRDTFSWTLVDRDAASESGNHAREAAAQAKVLTWLAANPNSGSGQIRKGVGGKSTVCDAAVKALVESGRITSLGKGKGFVVAAPEPPAAQVALFDAA